MGPDGAVAAAGSLASHADQVVLQGDIAAVEELLETLRALASSHDREDLATRLADATDRVARTETLVCVVGEFKKGKSALINALLDRHVCPVDDDLATAAVTVVRHATEPTVTVRRREGGRLVVETVAPDDVASWVVENEAPGERRMVELVEIGIPHPLLERGVALVDTPGVGGLNAAHAVATLAFLPTADALVFVTDASAELSAPELEFLGRAVDAGPPIMIAITKVDMYPEWRRIAATDSAHLAAAGLELEPYPVSSVLRAVASERGDDTLAIESGMDALAAAVVGSATDGSRARAIGLALAEAVPAILQLREPLETERDALERPETVEAMEADLRGVRQRLAELADADSRWSVRLDDEFDGLRSRIVFSFQNALRLELRQAQDEVERVDPGAAWEELSQHIQNEVAAIVRRAFLEATDGAVTIQATISEMLADTDAWLGEAATPIMYEVSGSWAGSPEFRTSRRRGLLATVGLVSGATVFGAQLGTVGIEMLGLLGTLLGATIIGPAVVGAALLLGGKQVVDERKRQLADRRQQARSFLATFVEDVRFEVEGRLTMLLGDLERQMRSRFIDRLRQLQRTNEEAAEALEGAVEQSSAGREARLETLRIELASLDALHDQAVATAERLEASQRSAERGSQATEPASSGVPGT
jgi:hypothetical protein